MNVTDLANVIADRHGLTKAAAKNLVTDVFAEILGAAKRGDDTIVPGFGKFAVKQSPAREGRNPATGAAIQIAASNKLTLSVAKAAKEALNG